MARGLRLHFAAAVGEGDSGKLGTIHGVNRGQADEMEQLIDFDRAVERAGDLGHRISQER